MIADTYRFSVRIKATNRYKAKSIFSQMVKDGNIHREVRMELEAIPVEKN